MKYLKFISLLLISSVVFFTASPASVSNTTTEANLARIEHFFNNALSFSADFVQVDSKGLVKKGRFFIKDKKLKLKYTSPEPKTIIIKNDKAIIYDETLQEKTVTSIYSSPFYPLVKPRAKLREHLQILDMTETNDEISVKFCSKENNNSTVVNMHFTKQPLAISAWEWYEPSAQYPVTIKLSAQDFQTQIDDAEFNEYD